MRASTLSRIPTHTHMNPQVADYIYENKLYDAIRPYENNPILKK